MPLNEQSQFFSNAVFPSQNSPIPDETKKMLGPKPPPPLTLTLTPPPPPQPNFQALIFYFFL